MDRKIAQRTIGVFVLIALVIIMLPFFFSKSESTTEVSKATTPPAPTVIKSAEINTPTANIVKPVATTTVIPSADQPPTQQTLPVAESVKTNTPVPPNQLTTPSQVIANNQNNNEVVASTDSYTQPKIDQKTETLSPTTPELVNNESSIVEQATTPVRSVDIVSKSSKKIHKELHQAAWVVQMGSFKNKDNARRLTDRLRVAGFKAFTQTIKQSGKERFHVCIGPEFKRATALQLSNEVAKKINMQGIIVIYKPLAL